MGIDSTNGGTEMMLLSPLREDGKVAVLLVDGARLRLCRGECARSESKALRLDRTPCIFTMALPLGLTPLFPDKMAVRMDANCWEWVVLPFGFGPMFIEWP